MTLKRARSRADHLSMRSAHADQRGYTLIELMVAALVMVIGMAGAFALLDGANKTTVVNNARTGATNLARELLEDARSVDYDSLTPTGVVPALQAKSGTSGNPWRISRRGIVYTITANVCTFDDPKDNVATTPPANVCTPQAPVPASAGTLEPEIQPDDFRRVTVNLAWNTGAGDKTLTQVSLINNPSGGLGPRITRFDPPLVVGGSPAQLTTGNSATFPTETSTAGSVRWNSDGTPNGAGDSTGGPTVWTSTWQLGTPANGLPPTTPGWTTGQFDAATTVLDGTYTVTAQAFDDRGIAGDSRVAVLPLNRSWPITVTGLEVGRNYNVGKLELRWNQNPELDIIGYHVYDSGPDNVRGNGNDTLVCQTANVRATSCLIDLPAGTPTYYVVAVDREDIIDTGSNPRESNHAQPVSFTNTQPAAPSMLVVLPDLSTGKPRLDWSHPNPGAVRYFRIYRDACCTPADRYDATTTNATNYTDPSAPSGTHRYWVTAVGPGLNESLPSNEFSYLVP